MRILTSLCGSLVILMVLACLAPGLSAGESTSEIIDKTNWEKAEGLVPDCLLEWVKKGEWVLPVGELSYDPSEYFPPYGIESLTGNAGKYDLNEEDIIVEAETGKMAKMIIGFPFPEVDPEAPKAAIKMMYNKQYVTYIIGNKKMTIFFWWLGRKSGFEREIESFMQDAYFTGFPGAGAYKNPKDLERYVLMSVRAPYDLAGTAQMMWRYLSAKADMNYAFLPAIRRVRRVSPANRSDGFVGSDLAADDILAYDGKIPAFEWELIGKKEALVPFAGSEPMRAKITEKGEWDTSGANLPTIRYGYQDKEWQGAPWAPQNPLYVKRPVWVIRANAKDPYYNYGTQDIWVLEDLWGPAYKTVHDRSGKFWKFMSVTTAGSESDDGEVKFLSWRDHLMVDVRREHATINPQLLPKTVLLWNAVVDMNDFSLAGFQKYCK